MATMNITCTAFPTKIYSNGIWDWKQDPMTSYPLSLLLLQFFVIFVFSETTHFLLKRLGIPKFVSQIISGLILSPELLGGSERVKNLVFPIEGQRNLETLGLFGYTMFMFLACMKVDLKMIPNAGRTATYIGVLSVTIPMIVCWIAMNLLGDTFDLTTVEQKRAVSILSATHSATNFPVVSVLLYELKIINFELGRLSLSSAIIGNFITFLFRFSSLTLQDFMNNKDTIYVAILNLLGMLGFVVLLVFVIRPAMFWVIRQTPEGRPVKRIYICSILVLVFASGLLTHKLGHFVFLGPVIFGIAIPDGPPLGSALEEKLDSFISGVLLPVFATSVFWSPMTYKKPASSSAAVDHFDVNTMNIIAGVLSFLIKVVVSSVPPWLCNMPLFDALAVGLIMGCKGIVEVGTYAMFRDDEFFTQETFIISVVYVIISASAVAILVGYLYDPAKRYSSYRRRNIMNVRPDAELRMLTCIYRPFDIPSIINFLNISNPTQSNQMSILVLHLIEMVGSLSPVFISHQLQNKSDSKRSCSENVISAFREYASNENGIAKLNIFTAISPASIMDEDIRILALNRQASLIVLPFHKKWASSGSTELEDSKTTRIINCNVLERAPCSVGVLIHHGYGVSSKESAYRMCLIFIGGNDDREALALVKRIATNSRVEVTVVRLLSPDKLVGNELDWDGMLDAEELKYVKQMSRDGGGDGEMEYMEHVVADGSVTTLIARSLINDYDLMIVGRRHEATSTQISGLAHLCEFQELGILGDLLVSRDVNTNTSVLVVQQQQLNLVNNRKD